MLQYRSRFSNDPALKINVSRHPLLTYCNWSHHISRHIDEDTLVNMLRDFEKRYTHFYIRIINETPKRVTNDFIMQHELDPNTLRDIYDRLDTLGFDLRDWNEF